ncbi:hypothetical protein DSUL_20264 [Desulfovibrionales bacterium]
MPRGLGQPNVNRDIDLVTSYQADVRTDKNKQPSGKKPRSDLRSEPRPAVGTRHSA